MNYKDQLCTVYKVENGFVVECQEPKAPSKDKKSDGCCMPDSMETKTYTAGSVAAALKIVKARVSADTDEYADGFDEAAKAEK